MERWIEANIHFSETEPNAILLNQIKPFITRLEEEDKLFSFHVLGEPGPRLLLRILTSEENYDEIIASINTWENPSDVSIEFREYQGERDKFGDAWESVFQVMEAGTRCRLDIIDEGVSKTAEYNVVGLNHYLLNSMGFNVFQEASLHAQMVVERLAILNQLQRDDIMERVRTLIQSTTDQAR